MCDHISIMYKGRFVETGDKKIIYSDPRHIYTKRLIAAIPNVNPLIRDEKEDFRAKIDKEYKELENLYYDEKEEYLIWNY